MYKWTDMYKCTWTWIYFTTVWTLHLILVKPDCETSTSSFSAFKNSILFPVASDFNLLTQNLTIDSEFACKNRETSTVVGSLVTLIRGKAFRAKNVLRKRQCEQVTWLLNSKPSEQSCVNFNGLFFVQKSALHKNDHVRDLLIVERFSILGDE